jgi:hypothetical protein
MMEVHHVDVPIALHGNFKAAELRGVLAADTFRTELKAN